MEAAAAVDAVAVNVAEADALALLLVPPIPLVRRQ